MAPIPIPSFIARTLSRFYRHSAKKTDDNNDSGEDIESLLDNFAQIPPFHSHVRSNSPYGPTGPVSQPGPPCSFGAAPVWPQQQVPTVAMLPPPASFQSHLPYQLRVSEISLKDQSKEDCHPMSRASVILHETRQGKLIKPSPPVTREYILKDKVNCCPCYIRCTLNQIPCTIDLLKLSGMPLALMVQPLALTHPYEEPIPIVDFGESGPIRCACCKAYMNPFMKFIDHGKSFICKLCGTKNKTPYDYHCNLRPDGRRLDSDERPELYKGTVEFVASKEFMMRDLLSPVYFFLIDVSMNAIETGATAAACGAVKQVISDLPERPSTMVGIATYDSSIQFYKLKPTLQQPLMFVVADTTDVYTPLKTDVIVNLYECRKNLETLLDNIPTMFQANYIADSAFCAAIKAASLAMKTTGGKLLVFQSGLSCIHHTVLPSTGLGALTAREREGISNITSPKKEKYKLLQPADKLLNTMAMELAAYQVCVDVFITTQTYVDIASIFVIPKTTGGQIYYYYPFSVPLHAAKLYSDLSWNITRPQGFEATMRVRCSKGLQVQEYSGNFCTSFPADIDLPGIDCDKSIMVTLKLEDKFLEGSECVFQSALLYTTIHGQRRIRVSTLSLPCTNVLMDLFQSADLEAQLSCFLKQVANEIPTSPTIKVQEQLTNICINILLSYLKFCNKVSTCIHKVFPEILKLLPLYTLALMKSSGMRSDARLDDRSYWISRVSSISTSLAVVLVYPRMIAVHTLLSEETDGSVTDPTIPLTREYISEDGIFLLENGEDALIYIGDRVNPHVLDQLFGIPSTEFSTQSVLQQCDNPLSRKFNDFINGIRPPRSPYPCLLFCKKGDPLGGEKVVKANFLQKKYGPAMHCSNLLRWWLQFESTLCGMLFESYMIEDESHETFSYSEFLLHIQRQVQDKLSEGIYHQPSSSDGRV